MRFENPIYPKFYQEIVQTWANVCKKEPSNAFEACNECLWNNKLITSNGGNLYNRHLFAKGTNRVQDIIGQNGSLLLWSDAQEKYSLNSSLILNPPTAKGGGSKGFFQFLS